VDQHNDQEEQGQALLLEAIRHTLRTPHGYAVILHLLDESGLFIHGTDPPGFIENFFQDLEQADPAAALRLFAALRGIPIAGSG